MTLSAFDPHCLGGYPAADPPEFLHFQWRGSEIVHRYMLVDKIHPNDINPSTKLKTSECTAEDRRRKYLHFNRMDLKPTMEEPPPAELPTQTEIVDKVIVNAIIGGQDGNEPQEENAGAGEPS